MTSKTPLVARDGTSLTRLFKPRPKSPPADGRLRDAAHMLAALHRQRLIADRTGRGFAWITFDCAGDHGVVELDRLLARRVRATDEVGLAPAELCADDARATRRRGGRRLLMALLPDTGSAGAGRLVRAVEMLYLPADRAPAASVFTYFGNSDLPAEQRRAADAPAGEPEQPSADHAFASGLPWWKRGIDLTVAGVGLLVLSPLLLLVALAIRLDSRGAAIFWQPRAGRGGRAFRIAKFRTMVADAEARQLALKARSEQDGPAFKLRRDPRVTRVGLLLRSTSLDELPQLWNVLRGEMTLVGPRPLPLGEARGVKPWQRRRLDVTPGLTCIWQVHGRSRVSFDEWMRMDLKYVARHRSPLGPLHDATLLLKTVPAVFVKRGF